MIHRSRRLFQLSLNSLFGLTLLVATFFAGYVSAERRAERAEAALKAERLERNKLEEKLWHALLEYAPSHRVMLGQASGTLMAGVE